MNRDALGWWLNRALGTGIVIYELLGEGRASFLALAGGLLGLEAVVKATRTISDKVSPK